MSKYKMERKVVQVSSLVENPKNPNMHPKEQIEDIAKSIKEYGQYYPIIIDEKNIILAGHGKKKALESLGETNADCIVLHGLSEKQKLKLLLSDNKIQSFSFLNHTIEDEVIKEIGEVGIIGFSDDYISDLIKPVTYDSIGVSVATPNEEYASQAREMNNQIAEEGPSEEIPTDDYGQPTQAYEDDPMASFTAKHIITCPHCGKPIEI